MPSVVPTASAEIPTQSPTRSPDALRAFLLVAAASVLFAFMNAFAKYASRHVPALEVACTRGAISAVMVYGWAYKRGISLKVGNQKAMWIRTICGAIAMMMTFVSLSALPLAETTALLNTAPILIAVLGWIFLGERVGPALFVALITGFVGVCLIVRPGAGLGWMGLLPLGAAIFSAISLVSLRRLGATESAEAIVAHFSLGATLMIGVVGAAQFTLPSWTDALAMLGAGVTATIAQLLMTRAYAMDRAARMGVGGYLTVLVSAALGITFFGEPLTLPSLFGMAVLIVGGIALAIDGQRAEQRPAQRAV